MGTAFRSGRLRRSAPGCGHRPDRAPRRPQTAGAGGPRGAGRTGHSDGPGSRGAVPRNPRRLPRIHLVDSADQRSVRRAGWMGPLGAPGLDCGRHRRGQLSGVTPDPDPHRLVPAYDRGPNSHRHRREAPAPRQARTPARHLLRGSVGRSGQHRHPHQPASGRLWHRRPRGGAGRPAYPEQLLRRHLPGDRGGAEGGGLYRTRRRAGRASWWTWGGAA